jgi:hypothetical protein
MTDSDGDEEDEEEDDDEAEEEEEEEEGHKRRTLIGGAERDGPLKRFKGMAAEFLTSTFKTS